MTASRRQVLAGGSLGLSTLVLPAAAAHASEVFGPAATSGDGTAASPFLIASYGDLEWMSTLYAAATAPVVGLEFRLVRDVIVPVDATPLTPIPAFSGVLDGRDFSISGLTVSVGTAQAGLFASLTADAVVRDLTLLGASITGSHEVGALAGRAVAGAQVSGVHVRVGTITATREAVDTAADTGGLVGYAVGGTFTACSSTARVVATRRNVGGLVGDGRGTFRRCWASGDVGPPDGGTSADAAYGGLIGLCVGATVEDCYARGSVTATVKDRNDGVGGLIGLRTSGTATRAYATGAVQVTEGGTAIRGGLTAVSSGGTTSASFWDTTTTGLAATGESAGATGRTTAQLQDQATFTGADWNLTTVWAIDPVVNGGYPSLRDNPPA